MESVILHGLQQHQQQLRGESAGCGAAKASCFRGPFLGFVSHWLPNAAAQGLCEADVIPLRGGCIGIL